MQSLRRIFTLILTTVFIYSAVGQAIVSHYCHIKQSESKKESCCEATAEKDCCGEVVSVAMESNDACCSNIISYQVNPFSVQKPGLQKEISCDFMLIPSHVPAFGIFETHSVNTGIFTKQLPLPHTDICITQSILLI